MGGGVKTQNAAYRKLCVERNHLNTDVRAVIVVSNGVAQRHHLLILSIILDSLPRSAKRQSNRSRLRILHVVRNEAAGIIVHRYISAGVLTTFSD